MKETHENIDAVITWVDGDDPDHYKRRESALKSAGKLSSHQLPTRHHKARFIDNGEINF